MITVPEPKSSAPEELLENIAHRAFAFFYDESHPDTGLTKDRATNLQGKEDAHFIASIAATGYALASLPIAVERKWLDKPTAAKRALLTLRFVYDKLPNVHGFHYHFVDWKSGDRVWKCELSSIDTALLLNGALAAGQYFGGEIGKLADAVYARCEWPWMQNRKPEDSPAMSLSMGWRPEEGFLASRWHTYNEASYLYLLAMGAPRYPLPPETWDKWDVPETALEGFPVFGGPGPIFFAQMTPAYYDLRGKRDRKGRDWQKNFENAHRANLAYCRKNAGKFKTYGEGFWGITACDQPPEKPGGEHGYGAQDPIDGANDGTVAPTAMFAGIIFLPEVVRKDVTNLYDRHRDRLWGKYGFGNAFNVDKDWYDNEVLGLDFGMMLLALENARSGLLWKLMSDRPDVKKGVSAAGFRK